MARFLSPGWMDEATQAASSSPEAKAAAAGVRLVVQQVVTGGPQGEVAYAVEVDDGCMSFRTGRCEQADVTFTLDWDTAVAMARGDLGGQEAFTAGRLRLRGNVGLLLRHGPALAGLATVFAQLRDGTTF